MMGNDRLLAASGAALILLASILYATLPPEVVLPVADPNSAANGPGNHLTTLQWAGRIGLVGDFLLITGALRLMRQGEAWFWGLTALATLVFVGFDYMTARPLAVLNPAEQPILREMMSGLFVLGLCIFALAALDAPKFPRLSKTGGALVLATACLWLFVPLPPLIFGLWLFASLALIFTALAQTGLSTRAVT